LSGKAGWEKGTACQESVTGFTIHPGEGDGGGKCRDVKVDVKIIKISPAFSLGERGE